MDESSKIVYVGLDVHQHGSSSPGGPRRSPSSNQRPSSIVWGFLIPAKKRSGADYGLTMARL